MAAENQETTNGWPLVLQIMAMKLRLQERIQYSTPAVEPHSPHIPSPSFSSFCSSSNIDTESTASFFQDNNISLGKLIGFRQRDTGSVLYLQSTIGAEQNTIVSGVCNCNDVSRGHCGDLCGQGQGICIPMVLGTLVKITRSRSKSK
ncbi:hypothetical protein ERO13_D06G135900v2 [Gossypium hirsutum]|uniref:Uncharacterized protein n=4 Tax=Gossypium TaxID=3633 RepID=A0A1U8ITU7_GOSHI|nr:uncharacterized protein LOC107900376 [Gossypium hirsutum]KAB2025572.1 hypothetical protein ES319_D06G158800v1 [Gossypium barbadense]TYG65236.1 hypothetical protein ES288_D06G169800v1 [Gossypium darwinii]TYH67202.1 hypothetical protein ES332_D06G172200v1 [Gossypium tomentosum]KAG4142547.1 hypothetical protein ERO13_D06G135900v2 [Gossypium hirsutum]PPD99715.1 hypothetical protein GOBAR_DD03255 [Gossypium barbadense]